jgi:hypothetical protein
MTMLLSLNPQECLLRLRRHLLYLTASSQSVNRDEFGVKAHLVPDYIKSLPNYMNLISILCYFVDPSNQTSTASGMRSQLYTDQRKWQNPIHRLLDHIWEENRGRYLWHGIFMVSDTITSISRHQSMLSSGPMYQHEFKAELYLFSMPYHLLDTAYAVEAYN